MRYAAFLSAASLALSAPLHAQNSEGTTVPQPTSPPTAEKRDHSYSHHGITISDPYHWLRDQSYPTIDDEDVLDHLKAENAWFEARMKPQQPLVDELFAEMKARIKEDDSTVPQRRGDYLYWSEFEEGAEYRKYYRKPVAGGDDVLILDENALAEGVEYFRLGAFSVSQNGRYLAYSADTNGSERFTARIKDLETGELLPDEIPGTLSDLVWVKNDTALVYGTADDNWRVHDATMHVLGTPVSEDVELYRETMDEGFRVGTGLSAQEDWL
ncbi:MAG TPA: S9 family peptidase, partial [Erythrobacter sp.]|nr:S9 family peptidase [Erythrobacter sp.]